MALSSSPLADAEQVDIKKIGATFDVLLRQHVIERAPLSLVAVLAGTEDPNYPGVEAASAHQKQRFQLPADHDDKIGEASKDPLSLQLKSAMHPCCRLSEQPCTALSDGQRQLSKNFVTSCHPNSHSIKNAFVHCIFYRPIGNDRLLR